MACKKSGCSKRIRVLVFGEGKNAGVRTNTFSNINFRPFSKHISTHDKKPTGKGETPATTLFTFFNNAEMVNAAECSCAVDKGTE